MGWAYMKSGMPDQGVAELERAAALAPENVMYRAQLGQAYAMADKTADAREMLRQLEQLSQKRYVSPYHMAYVYTGLGESDHRRHFRLDALGIGDQHEL